MSHVRLLHECLWQLHLEANQDSSAGEWVNRLWYTHPMQYDTAIKPHEHQTHTTAWTHCRIIMLSTEARQKTSSRCGILFTENSRKCKLFHSDRKQVSYFGSRGWREGWITKGHKDTFGGDGYAHYLIVMMVSPVYICQNSVNQTCEICVVHCTSYTSMKLWQIPMFNLLL